MSTISRVIKEKFSDVYNRGLQRLSDKKDNIYRPYLSLPPAGVQYPAVNLTRNVTFFNAADDGALNIGGRINRPNIISNILGERWLEKVVIASCILIAAGAIAATTPLLTALASTLLAVGILGLTASTVYLLTSNKYSF